ncbi:MAG: hypothetical protein A4E73_03145 [Syntrophaceae bacterium PtaU1.Bin231]|nr:MAG: hypothetical protein A4E73_03145 [Syntrophaceae bacterium PtaU1.Bin231]
MDAEHQERLFRRENGKGEAVPGPPLYPVPDREFLVVEPEVAGNDCPLKLDLQLPVAADEARLVLGAPVRGEARSIQLVLRPVSLCVEDPRGPVKHFPGDEDVQILRLPERRVPVEHHGQGRTLERARGDARWLEGPQDPGELGGQEKRPGSVIAMHGAHAVHDRRGNRLVPNVRKGSADKRDHVVPLAEAHEAAPVQSCRRGRRWSRPVCSKRSPDAGKQKFMFRAHAGMPPFRRGPKGNSYRAGFFQARERSCVHRAGESRVRD